MNPYEYISPTELSRSIADKLRERRLSLGWKQSTLAERSGVSLGSLRRFESQGLISLSSLLSLAMALGHLDDFTCLFDAPKAMTLKELEDRGTTNQRGRL